MLGMNKYPQSYIDECRARFAAQVSAYQTLVASMKKQTAADTLDPASEAFEPTFFNNLVLALELSFVNRSRTLELKDGNPLNEVRMLAYALMYNNGIMTAHPDHLFADGLTLKTIKYDPAKSVLKYRIGDEINLTEADFTLLSAAFFADIERKFL
jgi:hypothetical protein